MERRCVRGEGWQTNEELPEAPPLRHNKEDDSLSLQDQVQLTICEVRGVERQAAAQVLINPPAGFKEVFTLWTEGRRLDTRPANSSRLQVTTCQCAPSTGEERKSCYTCATCNPSVLQLNLFLFYRCCLCLRFDLFQRKCVGMRQRKNNQRKTG